jgi:nucleotidyltransferase substrate binding protein (TIGR01987 family)
VLRPAYAAGWIEDENGWIDLLTMRNKTSHIYSESMARQIYAQIGRSMPLLRNALAVLQTKAA